LKQQKENAPDEPKTCDKEPFLLKAQLLLTAERFDQAIGTVINYFAKYEAGRSIS
jgi:hypothetical protein